MRRRIILSIVFSLIIISGTTPVFAQVSAGSNSPGVNPFAGPPITGGDSISIPQLTISACDPVSSCPPILKQIEFSVPQTQTVTIHEEWIVGQGPDWWDWHEVVLTNGWSFSTVEIAKTPANNSCDNIFTPIDVSGSITSGGLVIWIDFAQSIGLLTQGDKLCIWKQLSPPPSFEGILEIEEWPTIHQNGPVGGIGLPIDTTALLLASAQSISLWMIPVLAGIGIGIFVIRKRF